MEKVEGKKIPAGGKPESAIDFAAVPAPNLLPRVTIDEVVEKFSSWLYIEDPAVVTVPLAVVTANLMPGDPLWVFMIAPSSSGKSEALRALSPSKDADAPTPVLAEMVYSLSTLSPHALISGRIPKAGEDEPSLLPQLDGKTLVIKDFTSILSGRDETRRVIFSQLRDAFDGYSEKAFSGGIKSFKSRFGILAGVTPAIDRFRAVEQELGERFVKFRVRGVVDRTMPGRKALLQSKREPEMRQELNLIVERFFTGLPMGREIIIPKAIEEKLLGLASVVSVARSAVARDRWNETILYRPEPELSPRLVKQLLKLGLGLAAVAGKFEVGEEEFALVRRVGFDSLPAREFDILTWLWRAGEAGLSSSSLSEASGYPTPTCSLVCENFRLLGIVNRRGKGKFLWSLRPEIRGQLDLVMQPEAEMVEFDGGQTPPPGVVSHE